jgi:hypothetical protein
MLWRSTKSSVGLPGVKGRLMKCSMRISFRSEPTSSATLPPPREMVYLGETQIECRSFCGGKLGYGIKRYLSPERMARDARMANAKRRIAPCVATVDTATVTGVKGRLIECFMSLRGVRAATECAVIKRGAAILDLTRKMRTEQNGRIGRRHVGDAIEPHWARYRAPCLIVVL